MCIRDRDTEDIAPQDEATVPERWDEGEEDAETSQTSASEIWTTAGEEDEDSLPELVSGSEDSGYEFLNTPKAVLTEEKAEEEPGKDVRKKKYSMTEEEELESSIDFILNMEDPNYKEPEPCIGLTCPLTGEQYYVD